MYRIAKLQPKRILKKRRKLRSLVAKETPDEEQSSSVQFAGVLVFALCMLTIGFLGLRSLPWSNFLVTYRDQYNLLVHGEKDYCKPVMDTRNLFLQVGEHVLNQKEALHAIEVRVRNDSKFTAIAVVGRTGVGKSLFAHTLHDHFPWQENTQMYSWRNFHTKIHRQDYLQSALRSVSDCGRNLIVIDNLTPEDLSFVQEYTNLARMSVENFKANLIVLYVINVPSYTEEQRVAYDEKMDQIRRLEDVATVEFRKFGRDELADCILLEARNLNYTLDENSLADVIESIDVELSGCKNVHPKVLMYGQSAQ